jgi:FtsP/CotA-like multicopper oxidase with cupredoxin domain
LQSRKLSLGIAAGAIALAVVLFVVLKGGDDSSSSTTTAAQTTKGASANGKQPKGSGDEPSATKISFENGAPVGGVQEIDVTKGDPVRLEVTPDVPAEVHVHGYELEKEVDAGQTARFDFTATAEGVFEVEAHHLAHGTEEAGVQLAELTVSP